MSDRALATTQSQSSTRVTPSISGVLQRKCACGNHTMSGECEECKKNKGMFQRAPLSPRGRGTEGEGVIPPIVHEVLRSPGQPLDAATRAFMEPRFGHDFSQVRVHTDAKAAESADSIQASAYTVGTDIVFGAGQFAPETPNGQRTLAHELTHVIQQSSTLSGLTPGKQSSLVVGDPADPSELTAERLADRITTSPCNDKKSMLSVESMPTSITRPLLQRQPVPGTSKRSSPTKGKEAAVAYESEKEAEAWEMIRTHVTPELLIKFQEIGRVAAFDARNSIEKTFASYEDEISTPDQTFLNIFLGGAGNVPQGELGGFLGGAGAAGLQAILQAILDVKSVAAVKERARSDIEGILAGSLTSESPLYEQFENGALSELRDEFDFWWQAHPEDHDHPGAIRAEARLLQQMARHSYGANSERGREVRTTLQDFVNDRLEAIKDKLKDAQDAYRRKRRLGIATSIGAGIGLLAGSIVGGVLGGGVGAAVGALIGGLAGGAAGLGVGALINALTPSPADIRERNRRRARGEAS